MAPHFEAIVVSSSTTVDFHLAKSACSLSRLRGWRLDSSDISRHQQSYQKTDQRLHLEDELPWWRTSPPGALVWNASAGCGLQQ